MDNEIAASAIAVTAAYILGSVPAAYLVGRLRQGVDIRQVGTRNMGAMNTIYSVGLGWGLLVLFADIGKGALSILLARWLGAPEEFVFVAGGAAVAGHIFPVFLRFSAGKGGAVTVGVLSVLLPPAVPIAAGVFLVVVLFTRFPTLSYSLALLVAPFGAWLIYHSGALVLYSVILLLLVLARYASRIVEMRSRAGGWKHVFMRRNLQDRF